MSTMLARSLSSQPVTPSYVIGSRPIWLQLMLLVTAMASGTQEPSLASSSHGTLPEHPSSLHLPATRHLCMCYTNIGNTVMHDSQLLQLKEPLLQLLQSAQHPCIHNRRDQASPSTITSSSSSSSSKHGSSLLCHQAISRGSRVMHSSTDSLTSSCSLPAQMLIYWIVLGMHRRIARHSVGQSKLRHSALVLPKDSKGVLAALQGPLRGTPNPTSGSGAYSLTIVKLCFCSGC